MPPAPLDIRYPFFSDSKYARKSSKSVSAMEFYDVTDNDTPQT